MLAVSDPSVDVGAMLVSDISESVILVFEVSELGSLAPEFTEEGADAGESVVGDDSEVELEASRSILRPERSVL